MSVRYELGDTEAPRGHALVYFRARPDDQILATYLIVLPVPINLNKYIPPALAPRLAAQAEAADTVSITALPPIPEQAGSLAELRRLAAHRGDDLLDAGTIDASDPERLMYATHEVAQEYGRAYKAAADRAAPLAEPQAAPDEETLRILLMSEKERLSELVKHTGQLRYAVDGNDATMVRETVALIEKIAQRLPPKYRMAELLEAAQLPGARGRRLAELYIDRCFKLADEAYESLAPLEDEIASLRADG